MRYRLEDIEAFVAVVETGSISAAAVRLDVVKSVVSKRVAALEDGLGAALLQRSTRRASPTPNGMRFFERTKALMQELDEAAQLVTGEHRGLQGTVRLSVPMSFGHLHVMPALVPFLQANGDLSVQMDLDDRHVDLAQGGYDLAIRVGALADSELVARKLTHSKRVLCCSPAYLGRKGRPSTLGDLAHHECIGYGLVSSSHIWQFNEIHKGSSERSPRRLAATVHTRIVSNNGEAMVRAVLAGLGVTMLPTFLIGNLLRSGELVELELAGLTPTTDPIHAIYTRSRNLPTKVRAIIDVLADAWIGDAPPWDRPVPRLGRPRTQPQTMRNKARAK